MTTPIPRPPGNVGPESPPVAAAEARAVAPLLVSGIEAVARSRLLTVPAETRLVEVAARLSGAQISVVVVCDEAGAAMGTITETLRQAPGAGSGRLLYHPCRRRDDEGIHDLLTTGVAVRCAGDDARARPLHVLLIGTDNQPLGVLNARDGLRALLAAGNHEEALLRNYVMGIGYQ